MVRPHPALWRVIHGMVIIYLLALVFLVFQDVDDARQLLKVCPDWSSSCHTEDMKGCRASLTPCYKNLLHLLWHRN